MGFGKTVSQNLELISNGSTKSERWAIPIVGASRKSFIGFTLDLPPDQRGEGTAATTAVGIVRGADIAIHELRSRGT